MLVDREDSLSLLELGQVRSIAQGPDDEVSSSQQEANPWLVVVTDIR